MWTSASIADLGPTLSLVGQLATLIMRPVDLNRRFLPLVCSSGPLLPESRRKQSSQPADGAYLQAATREGRRASPARGQGFQSIIQNALLLNNPGEHSLPLSPSTPTPSLEHCKHASLGIYTITQTRGVLFNKTGSLESGSTRLSQLSCLGGDTGFPASLPQGRLGSRTVMTGFMEAFPHTSKNAMPRKSPRDQSSTAPLVL